MSRQVQLRDIAHARAGDKGNISNVSLFVFDPRHYESVKAQVTSARLKAAFGDMLIGDITRYTVDHMHALNFVMENALEGGVNQSLNLDAHGKSWSYLIPSLQIELT